VARPRDELWQEEISNGITLEDVSSPTVATKSVLLTCIIHTEEGRDVTVIIIQNAFIQMCIKEEKDMAIIKIRGVLVDMFWISLQKSTSPLSSQERIASNSY